LSSSALSELTGFLDEKLRNFRVSIRAKLGDHIRKIQYGSDIRVLHICVINVDYVVDDVAIDALGHLQQGSMDLVIVDYGHAPDLR
jgi:hypothetical protein